MTISIKETNTATTITSDGIFSTLTTWENDNSRNGLANDLVNDGHDVWEIEMNSYMKI